MKIPASWKTGIMGIAALLLACLQASHDASISAAIHDPSFQMAVVVGILGLVAKDFNVSGGESGGPPPAAK